MRIGIDMMGSDSPPELLWEGVLSARNLLPKEVELVIFAAPELSKVFTSSDISFCPSPQVIAMDDNPLFAVRRKKESSMMQALQQHAEGVLQAVVSCGNTGALYAGSCLLLPALPKIDRPALLVNFPTLKSELTLLDVGGNVECKAHHLVEFALLGSAYSKAVRLIETPRVALLNIGQEDGKGSAMHREAYEQLTTKNFNFQFIGNIEARDLFHSSVDVVICDGFSGNVLLKTAEGVSLFFLEQLKSCVPEDKFNALASKFHYLEHPGGFLCGIQGHVIKCHGTAGAQMLTQSILYASLLAKQNASKTIANLL